MAKQIGLKVSERIVYVLDELLCVSAARGQLVVSAKYKDKVTNALESLPSNVLFTPVANPTPMLGMLALQYSFDINAPFTNTATQIYFRMVPTVTTNAP